MAFEDRPVKFFSVFVIKGHVVPPRSCRNRLKHLHSQDPDKLDWTWKKIYSSLEEAQEAAAREPKLKAYSCRNCGMFHTGHDRRL